MKAMGGFFSLLLSQERILLYRGIIYERMNRRDDQLSNFFWKSSAVGFLYLAPMALKISLYRVNLDLTGLA